VAISVRSRFRKFSLIQIYAPQCRRPTQEKDQFYEMEILQNTTDIVKYKEKLIVSRDYNGHIGFNRRNLENVIGTFSAGDRNTEVERVINYELVNCLFVMNTFCKLKESHK